MLRRTMAVAGAVAALSLGACGGDSTTPTDTATPAPTPVITIAASPSEAAAAPSVDPGYQWTASFSVTLTETAGVPLTVRSINVNVQQAAGGIVVTPPTGLSEAFRYEIKSAGNRLPGNGTLTVQVTVLYPHGKISPAQEHQLTCWGGNVRTIAVRGVFDDCQRLVKSAFTDAALNKRKGGTATMGKRAQRAEAAK